MQASELVRRYAAGERRFGGAELIGADLSRANLSNADLSRADLSEANLHSANLSEANLTFANLNKARGISFEQLCKAKTLFNISISDALVASQIRINCPELWESPIE